MRTSIALVLFACALSLVACDKDKAAPTTTTASATPAATSAAVVPATAAPKPSAAPAAAKAAVDHPKALPADKKHALPKDWERLADAAKGFAYSVPKGTKHEGMTKDGIDIYAGKVPPPHEVETFTVVFKDATKTHEDLEKDAIKLLTALDQTDVKVIKRDEINADYYLLTMTMLDEKKVKFKAKCLIATDVTDNYLMFVGTPEANWAANEETIDEVWGSFEMWSGGASGTSK